MRWIPLVLLYLAVAYAPMLTLRGESWAFRFMLGSAVVAVTGILVGLVWLATWFALG